MYKRRIKIREPKITKRQIPIILSRNKPNIKNMADSRILQGTENTCTFGLQPLTQSFQFIFKDMSV